MALQPPINPDQGFILTLRQVPFFSNASDAVLLELAGCCVSKHYAKDQFIFLEGESCPGLFVVHQGSVKIFKLSDDGREQILAVETSGHAIAELPAFDDGPYPASARAAEETTLLLMPKTHIQRLFLKYPEIALGVVRSFSARLRRLTALVEGLAFKEVSQRLAQFLLLAAKKRGASTPEGIRFELPFTHQEIAARIGTVRELVSRGLSRFRDEGILTFKDHIFIIHDMERLQAETHTHERRAC
jgi:CRP/FNR family transcriptional regulator